MNNIEEEYTDEVFQAVSIGLIVADFLLSTNRVLKAVQLRQECFSVLYSKIHLIMKSPHIFSERGERIGGHVQVLLKGLRQCKYDERAQLIRPETGDKSVEALRLELLGKKCYSVGEYEKAKEYLNKALEIWKEIGEKNGEGSCYGFLGALYLSVGEYEKAKECHERALAISEESNDIPGEGFDCGNLANALVGLGEYEKANEYLQRALAIKKKTGDRRGEGTIYANLGSLYLPLGDYTKAKEYCEKALRICIETGEKTGEISIYGNLGTISVYLDEDVEAEEWFKKGLAISEDTGNLEKQMYFLGQLALIKLSQGNTEEAWPYLLPSIEKSEDLRGSFRSNDLFKISFLDKNVYPYWALIRWFCTSGSPDKALYASELGKARALTDLMSTQYSLEEQITANPQTWAGIEGVLNKEQNCTYLYFSYIYHLICFWVLKAGKVAFFQQIDAEEPISHQGSVQNLDMFFNHCRSFGVTSEEHCEDRSLNSITPQEEDYRNASRIGKEDEKGPGHEIDLSLGYKAFIAPVKEFLEGPEIIIVPDRSLYNVPFAALPDESGKFLSETFRIRVVPSLSTLKLITESPADYHCQTGALIVGDPDVGLVRYAGGRKLVLPLPHAKSEANMVGEKLGVKPLLGQQATKQAVLQAINSVSLIHFAAHGNEETGEIALAPAQRIPRKLPKEEDYLLTMSDIAEVQLRAKLVVLSCCHSARGQIRAEGAVGIARAFLGSGARSVLVALWALDDSATEQFMSHFYEHLVRGESASESLHEAMKWMRCNGYPEVRQWAPFMLIGDNVTFDFGNQN